MSLIGQNIFNSKMGKIDEYLSENWSKLNFCNFLLSRILGQNLDFWHENSTLGYLGKILKSSEFHFFEPNLTEDLNLE